MCSPPAALTTDLSPPFPVAYALLQFSSYYSQIQQQEMYEIQAWFRSVDRDGSGSITANEIAGSTHRLSLRCPSCHPADVTTSPFVPLRLLTVTFNGVPLGLDVATKLVRVFDRDGNRSIGSLLDLHQHSE
jgi:hypothetical protein